MNEEQLTIFYQQIAENINETIPEDWTKVYLYGEVAEGVRKSHFFYYPSGSTEPVYSHDIPDLFEIDEQRFDKMWYELLDQLQQLWEQFQNEENEPWTNLTLVLRNDGDFKIEYDYEDLSEADDHERAIIWENKYLSIIPEDEDDKKFLDEYLNSIKENKE